MLKVTPLQKARAQKGLQSGCYIRTRIMYTEVARHWKAGTESGWNWSVPREQTQQPCSKGGGDTER